jgi:hypothetical protein
MEPANNTRLSPSNHTTRDSGVEGRGHTILAVPPTVDTILWFTGGIPETADTDRNSKGIITVIFANWVVSKLACLTLTNVLPP